MQTRLYKGRYKTVTPTSIRSAKLGHWPQSGTQMRQFSGCLPVTKGLPSPGLSGSSITCRRPGRDFGQCYALGHDRLPPAILDVAPIDEINLEWQVAVAERLG
jgi:hypothetical protein